MAKILIVEDDADTAKAIARELKIAGHACAVHQRGNGVVEAAKKSTPDLLVLDVMIPDISGFQVCRTLRKDKAFDALPILIVSAMSSEEEVRHGLDQGADDYVTKPFQMADLLRRVEALLRNRRNHAEPVDELTALADAAGSRRELQRRITGGDHFALAYGELVNLRAFSKDAGAAGREKALRYVARALSECSKKFKEEEFFAGHMGGGHFMCIVPMDAAKAYCELVRRVWKHNLEHLYETQNKGKLYREALESEREDTLPDLLFCVTMRDSDELISPKQLLDIVARIRNNRLEKVAGGVYVDRRS